MIAADAILAADDDVVVEPAVASPPVFRLRRSEVPRPPDGEAAVAIAGIADPSRFFDDLKTAGWQLADALPFRDHHPYSARDLDRIVERVERKGAARIVTTEKDAVRLLRFRPLAVPIVTVPLRIEPHPAGEFREWLAEAIRSTRDLYG
jgi:tetraacyldisaccharide 4'-kinase